MHRPVNVSLAAFPAFTAMDAMARATQGVSEPAIGPLSLAETQICPQNRGQLTEEACAALRRQFPGTRFRLHANVQVLGTRMILDLSRWQSRRDYWQQLATISQCLDAPAYSAHAGRRSEATLSEVLDATRACEDLMGVPTAVEGHYPTTNEAFHIATLAEYRAVMESGVRYVVDLSHIHICAVAERNRDLGLVKALVENERCLEVHLSANNGRRDEHRLITHRPWWWPAIDHIHPRASVFSEGAQFETERRHRPAGSKT